MDFAVFLRYGNGLHMKPQITTVQNTTFSTEMLSLSKNALCFVQHFGKEHMSIYNDFDASAMNSALYCCTYCHMYVYILYIYTLFDTLFFHNSLCFSINMYLILNTHECNFQLQILHFLKSVLHPFMLFMSVFQKRTCPD